MRGATVLLKQSHDIIRISIHAPCVGSDHGPQGVPGAKGEFQSTLPVWGATCTLIAHGPEWMHFNPRSPCGERRPVFRREFQVPQFQSTLPVWGATIFASRRARAEKISIHAPRVGSDQRAEPGSLALSDISIHAPRVGSDVCGSIFAQHKRRISIHAPRVGSDGLHPFRPRRAEDFNPRSPCGERHSSSFIPNFL